MLGEPTENRARKTHRKLQEDTLQSPFFCHWTRGLFLLFGAEWRLKVVAFFVFFFFRTSAGGAGWRTGRGSQSTGLPPRPRSHHGLHQGLWEHREIQAFHVGVLPLSSSAISICNGAEFLSLTLMLEIAMETEWSESRPACTAGCFYATQEL